MVYSQVVSDFIVTNVREFHSKISELEIFIVETLYFRYIFSLFSIFIGFEKTIA